uniref:Uncharacterized protein n=1 Tax=Oryza barthii TaxID=65489 RepID=A0A0D3HLU0_9ORYZ
MAAPSPSPDPVGGEAAAAGGASPPLDLAGGEAVGSRGPRGELSMGREAVGSRTQRRAPPRQRQRDPHDSSGRLPTAVVLLSIGSN